MFRDNEFRYVVASVALAWAIAIPIGAYEIFVNRADTVLATALAVLAGVAVATGFTLLAIATLEVIMVLSRRVNERLLANAHQRGRQEGHQEGRQEGLLEGRQEERKRTREWYDSLPEEIRDQIAPPPDDATP